MTKLIEPHGGSGLIDRFVPDYESDSFVSRAKALKKYYISDSDKAIFYRIADGTLSPLEGPMTKDEFSHVLETGTIIRNSRKYAWTIPIAFPTDNHDDFSVGEEVAVFDRSKVFLGTILISSIFEFDKEKYIRSVYGTDRKDHPGPRMVMDDKRRFLFGGIINAVPDNNHVLFRKYMMSPSEIRDMFEKEDYERFVAFQTRNPLHKAHEYVMVYALETLMKKGYRTKVVLNPLVGETKSDDVPASVRMRTYEVLIDQKLIGKGDMDMEFWKGQDTNISDHISLIGLDIKMFYAGPKEAVMHAIYRQNMGFTDIIIGRRHADAPFDDGTPAWGDDDAQKIFESLDGELLIRPFNVGLTAFFKELGKVALADEHKGKGYEIISISGNELRSRFENEEPIDERVMRKPVSDILFEAYRNNIGALRTNIKSSNISWHKSGISKRDREIRNGHKGVVIWLTGLSASGKSTISVGLQDKLFDMGCNVFILDGDNIRHGLNKDLGFSDEDRKENIRRISEVAKLFSESGTIVITAFISPFKKDRDMSRSIMPKGDFIEVYVKASLKACEERDPKGLYKKARRDEIKDFTGISSPYEIPADPEITVDTEKLSKEECVDSILRFLRKKKIIGSAKAISSSE